MMVCPETYYEMNLKGKSAEEILLVIGELKDEIERLIEIVEHPAYECTMHPSEKVRITCSQDYLAIGKKAYEEAGGVYVPTATELKAMEFDANIPYIERINFSIGGFFNGYRTVEYTVTGNSAFKLEGHSFSSDELIYDDRALEEVDKEYLLEALKDLHIGEWRGEYTTGKYGYTVCDGTQWELEIYYSNGRKPFKVHGDNAYPYNFGSVLDLFGIEEDCVLTMH